MTNRKTCGSFYEEAVNEYAGTNKAHSNMFTAGFVHGLCEKVYLGACKAAMFRPEQDCFESVLEILKKSAMLYGLLPPRLLNTLQGVEVWILRDDSLEDAWQTLLSCEENSELWHEIRGSFCGVPVTEIDTKFHNYYKLRK